MVVSSNTMLIYILSVGMRTVFHKDVIRNVVIKNHKTLGQTRTSSTLIEQER